MGLRTKDVFRPARKRAPKAERESTIQRECVAFLINQGCLVAVTDAGALSKFGAMFRSGVPAGWPDLTGCRSDGKFIAIECKTKTGKQSEEQRAYQREIETRGGLYFLVRGRSDLEMQWVRQNILDSSH